MRRQFGERNITGFAKLVGVGVGTIQRIEDKGASVGVDIVERIAGKFQLDTWQLLVPGLDLARPPRLISGNEFAVAARKLRAAIDDLVDAEPLEDPLPVERSPDAPPPTPRREQLLPIVARKKKGSRA